MKRTNEGLRLWPTDLAAFASCPHLTSLELAVARGEFARPYRPNPHAELIREKGRQHEEAVLASLCGPGQMSARQSDAAETEAAMRAGAELIYQAQFEDGSGWRGTCDFLFRREQASDLGGWSYEPADAKLARAPRPEHVLQLCFYAERTGVIQGHLPPQMRLLLGSGEESVLRPADYLAYYRHLRERYLGALRDPGSSYPYPIAHCGLCDYFELCKRRWDEDDHLTLVAGVSREQVELLTAAGITTLEGLAEADPEGRPRGVTRDAWPRLRQQAALQLEHRRTGRHRWELLPLEPERGFALLPEPDEGDIYLDLEGHPFFEPARGLEYLFGLLYRRRGELVYEPVWARDREAEGLAFERVMDFIGERRERYPGLHVYHYGPYERSTLSRLMGEHGTREEEMDDLLRGQVLVDLFRVVRQGLRASVSSYSIKRIEELYGFERSADVSGGTAAIVLFEEWLESGLDELLAGIDAYNEEDCRSLELLHEWLLGLRPAELPWRPMPEPQENQEASLALLDQGARLREALLEGAAEGEPRWLVAQLLDYHRREAKPAWWEYFHHRGLDDEELLEDSHTMAHLQLEGAPAQDGGSLVYTFSFPPQEHRIEGQAIDPATGKKHAVVVDDENGTVTMRRDSASADQPLPRALMPPGPYDTGQQQRAVQRFAEDYLAGTRRFAGLSDLVERRPPRTDLGGSAVEAALALSDSYLFVQGPPGSGKTHVGADMAVALMKAGKRVGITAQSHRTIHNFLEKVEEAAHESDFTFRGCKKSSGDNKYVSKYGLIADTGSNNKLLDPELKLLAGTAWLFSRAEFAQHVDVLFIDEGGQYSLADTLAVGTAARSLILLGDPNQLAQVRQGAHPPGAGESALAYLLGEDETVREGMGLFLAHTWRLRPEICSFVSEAFYDGRLEANAVARSRSLDGEQGLCHLVVPHEGNRVRSAQEAEAIRAAIEMLVGRRYADKDGERKISHKDILVVAPYNAQVRLLRGCLPAQVRVGTVDKFQGQEAPVVFYSMASSSGEDAPRGLDFLFSRNRLNVAISRAQCLAVLVASPRLLEVSCATVEQMRLANSLCRLTEMATLECV